MANPQPDQFTRLSNELYEAIMQSDFTKRQRNILDLVIRMSYGCGKKFAILRPSDFLVVGVGRNHIGKELKLLASAGVLHIEGEVIQLNKNYKQWRINLISSYDPERLKKILQRNLSSGNHVPETGTNTPKTGTVNNAEKTAMFPKQEQECSQNRNIDVPKTGISTPEKTNGGKEQEPPKDILKINKEKIEGRIDIGDQISPTDFKQVEEHYILRRGSGFHLSPNDYESITSVLKDGIPIDDILAGIDQAFETYQPRFNRDRIRSFAYCETVIRQIHYGKTSGGVISASDRRQRKSAKEKARREEIPTAGGYYDLYPGLVKTVNDI